MPTEPAYPHFARINHVSKYRHYFLLYDENRLDAETGLVYSQRMGIVRVESRNSRDMCVYLVYSALRTTDFLS